MSIFDVFKGYTDKEKQLLAAHTEQYQSTGMSQGQAKSMATQMLDQAISEAKQEMSYDLPENFGDILLGETEPDNPLIAKFAEIVQRRLPLSRKDGATDDDIKWWWNRTEVERKMMLSEDNIAAMAMLRHECEKHPG